MELKPEFEKLSDIMLDGKVAGVYSQDTTDGSKWFDPEFGDHGSFRVNDIAQAQALCEMLHRHDAEFKALNLPE